MWAVQHLSETHHYSICPCRHGDVLTRWYLHTEGLCLMQLPLTWPDPDLQPKADPPAHPWQVPTSKEVPSTQHWGCPYFLWLPRVSHWGGGKGSRCQGPALRPQGTTTPLVLRELMLLTVSQQLLQLRCSSLV